MIIASVFPKAEKNCFETVKYVSASDDGMGRYGVGWIAKFSVDSRLSNDLSAMKIPIECLAVRKDPSRRSRLAGQCA